MNYRQQLGLIGGAVGSLLGLYAVGKKSIYKVDTGHKAFKFNKISGVGATTYREGWHFMIPGIEKPIIYNVRAQPTKIASETGTYDLQQVQISLRVLYKPDETKLQTIYRNLGMDYDQRVLPSIVNEVFQSVVAQYNAASLLAERDQVSYKIKARLSERLREFNIILDDVSIVDLVFGAKFKNAIDEKQIAEQEAQKTQYTVGRA